MAVKTPSVAARQRAFRATHAPEEVPLVGIWLRKGDAFCLKAGVITDSLRQLATDAIHEFWPEEEHEETDLSRGRTLSTPREHAKTASEPQHASSQQTKEQR